MPSFAELRAKAEKAKDASVQKMHSTRDKYSSQSSKNLEWDANHKRPPPIPQGANHSRNSSSISIPRASHPPPPPPPQRGPPPVRRDTRPPGESPAHTPSPPPPPPVAPKFTRKVSSVDTDKIDWAHLSPKDKEVFFSWLDEFFGRLLNVTIPPRQSESTMRTTSRPITPPRPPEIPTWSRPQVPAPSSEELVMSYPPPTEHGCEALDLAMYFTPSAYWDSPWYLTQNIPSPLHEKKPPSYQGWLQQIGSTKYMYGGIMFADLSICWYSVAYPADNPSADPNDPSLVQRSAKYLPPPAALDGPTLVEASETYGETIAAFAEGFEGTGQYCARGECWDLAAEALKTFAQWDYVPKPVPSTSRTHGHLIFCGRAARGGKEQAGRWRGGDTQVRRGDIVEWRSVRMGIPNGGYAILGMPDHTAVITRDAVPSRPVADGDSVLPSEIGSLEVMEQSVGTPPKRETYHLNLFQEGEVWIYRPISLETYVGVELSAQCPDNVPALSV